MVRDLHLIFCLSALDKSFQNPALPSDAWGGGGGGLPLMVSSIFLGPASKPASADKRGFRGGRPSPRRLEVKLISLLLKIWKGGILLVAADSLPLGKAHHS